MNNISELNLIAIVIWSLLFVGCRNSSIDICGTYVSNEDNTDTLFVYPDGSFLRVSGTTDPDSGAWSIDGNKVWFTNWVNRGEEYELFKTDVPELVGFTLKTHWISTSARIFYSPYESKYFEQIRKAKCSN